MVTPSFLAPLEDRLCPNSGSVTGDGGGGDGGQYLH